MAAGLVVRYACRGPTFRFLMIVLIQLVDVQAASTLVHVHVRVYRRLNLDGLSSVSLLGIQLTPVHGLDVHDVTLLVSRGVVRGGYNGLSGRIKTEVCLVHQLFVET